MDLGFSSRRRCFELLVLFVVAATAQPEAATAQRKSRAAVAFVHVTVVDGTGAAARPDQTVVVSGDRIDPLRLFIANGITSARNMSGAWAYLQEFSHLRKQIASGERVGPCLWTTGPIVDGSSAGRDAKVVVTNADEARQAVRRVKREGADFVKVYNLLSRESFFAIAEEAKAQNLPFGGHVPFSVGADEASNAGIRSIEHLDAILRSSSNRETEIRQLVKDWKPEGSQPVPYPVGARLLVDSFSVDKLRVLADRLRRNQTSVVPTLAVYWNRLELPGIDALRYVPPAYVEDWKRAPQLTSRDDARLQFEQCLTVVRELQRAGVRILAGTDAALHVPGFSLHDELSLLIKAGLTQMEALQAATVNPARAFHLTDQGTIEPGMRADLVLLDANPLDDIDNTRKIRTVVAAGRVFDLNELNAMLADIEKNASQWTGNPTR